MTAGLDLHTFGIAALGAAALHYAVPAIAKSKAKLAAWLKPGQTGRSELAKVVGALVVVAGACSIDGTAEAGWTIHIPAIADLLKYAQDNGLQAGGLAALVYGVPKIGGLLQPQLPPPQEPPRS